MTEKMPVCVYIRVSTQSTEQAETYEFQKNYFQNYFNNTEYELVKIYSDKKSGTTAKKRPSFLQMVYDGGVNWRIEQGKVVFYRDITREPLFKRIYVPTLSRFGRDVLIVDALRELKMKGVYVVSIEGNLNSEREADMKHMELYFWIAQQESEMKSERMKQALKRTAEAKLIFVNKLYGYNYADGKLTINEDEANVVRDIFEKYIEGYGVRRIANYLNEQGILSYFGKKWSDRAIKRMLKNEKYAGILIRNKWEGGKVFMKHAPKRKQTPYVYENHESIEPIITTEMFQQVQELYGSKINSVNQKGKYAGTSEFAGMIECVKCGANYNRNINKGKPYYNCATKKFKGRNACPSPNVSLDMLEWALDYFVNDGLQQTVIDFKDQYEYELNVLKNSLVEKIDNQQEQEAAQICVQLDELELQKKRVLKLYTMGKYKDEELEEITNEIEAEYDDLTRKLHNATMDNDDILKEISNIEETIRNVNHFKVGDHYTRDELMSMISKIKVLEAEHGKSNDTLIILQIEFKAFEKLYNISSKYHDDKFKATFSSISVMWNKTRKCPHTFLCS